MNAPTNLTTDRLTEPIGIGSWTPEFGWRLDGTAAQQAYELEVTEDQSTGASAVWRSGRVVDPQPFGARYAGPPLASRTRYWWRVRVDLADGSTSGWSAAASFETGVLDPAEWRARWITDAAPVDKKSPRTLYFRTVAELPAAVVRGRAYASALGWYRLLVNDTDLTGPALVPRWTQFDDEVEYQVYDVTDSFQRGRNTVGMVVAEGRFRGRIGAMSFARRYGDRLGAFAQIVLELADGSTVVLVTDDSWRVGGGQILTADSKLGERADLQISATDWMLPGGSAVDEHQAVVLPPHPRRLIAESVERVTEVRRLSGSVRRAPSGAQIVDFGQNLVGVVKIRLSGPAGTRVRMLYSELLDETGELDTLYLMPGRRPGGDWFQRDEAILPGTPVEHSPWFTIHGFRYLAVEGVEADLTDGDVEAIVLSTDLTPISEFLVSDERLQRLWRNVTWSLRGNFTDTPTDCPTRERSGWTGDIQVFGPTAVQLVDVDAYLRRYLHNAAVEQYPDGRLPAFIPAEESRSPGLLRNPMNLIARSSVGWGDVTVMLPWTLYEYYGDTTVLRAQYGSAKAWVDQLARRAATKRGVGRRLQPRLGAQVGPLERYIVDSGYHWGEWLRPDESLTSTLLPNMWTGNPVVATAYLANSSALLAKSADLLGEADDADRYRTLAERVRTAWRAAFVRDGGRRIGDDKQDDYVRALAFDLLDDGQRPLAADRLVELVVEADFHLGTGFLSTPMLLDVLVDAGHPDIAFRLLLQDTTPSWLYQVERGATTTWETWSGHRSDGAAESSHNHYAFGSVVKFLQERVAGLAPAEPGYRRLRIAPLIGGGGLTSASVAIVTPYGRAASSWRIEGSRTVLDVEVPAGTEADIDFDGRTQTVAAGFHQFTKRR